MVFASDDSDTSDSSGKAGGSGKGRSRGKDGSTKGDSSGKGDSRSCRGSYSRGTDRALASGTGSAGSHSGLEGPSELDPVETGESTVLPTSSSKAESGGEESA